MRIIGKTLFRASLARVSMSASIDECSKTKVLSAKKPLQHFLLEWLSSLDQASNALYAGKL
jgi:hypothetical protein